MESLNNILEKISTFNINANTNLDIQGIIDTYMRFDLIKNITIALSISITVLIIAYMIFKLIKKGLNDDVREDKLKAMEKLLNNFSNWEDVQKFEERLLYIQKYMPKNKKAREIK